MYRINHIRFLNVLLVLILTVNFSWGQIETADTTNTEDAFVFFDLTEELDNQLLPLDSLVAHAKAIHPTVMLNIELEQSAKSE